MHQNVQFQDTNFIFSGTLPRHLYVMLLGVLPFGLQLLQPKFLATPQATIQSSRDIAPKYIKHKTNIKYKTYRHKILINIIYNILHDRNQRIWSNTRCKMKI